MDGAVRIGVRVAPGAKRTVVVGRYGDGWKVSVAAPADGGRANDAVVRLLAEALSLPVGQVAIVAGHTSRSKVVEVRGLAAAAVEDALDRAATTAS